jgi:hypothetical protein
MLKTTIMKDNITITQGYEVHLLNNYRELTGSNDLTDILSGGEYLADGKSADSAFWEYWTEAVEKVKNGEPPLTKTFV